MKEQIKRQIRATSKVLTIADLDFLRRKLKYFMKEKKLKAYQINDLATLGNKTTEDFLSMKKTNITLYNLNKFCEILDLEFKIVEKNENN